MGILSDGNIKKLIGQGPLKDMAEDLTVIDPNKGTYDPDQQTFTGGGTENPHTCKGFVLEYGILEKHDPNVTQQDRKILILADTLAVDPQREWTVTDDQGNEFEIVDLQRDPAGATWTIQGRL